MTLQVSAALPLAAAAAALLLPLPLRGCGLLTA